MQHVKHSGSKSSYSMDETLSNKMAGNSGSDKNRIKTAYILYFILGIAIVGTILKILDAILDGNANVSSYASVLTALATITLVIVTYEYVIETRDVAQRTQEQVETQRNLWEEEREVQWKMWHREQDARKNQVRKALLTEIEGAGLDILQEDGFELPLPIDNMVNTSVYDNNIDKLGMLDEEVRESIYDYYQKAKTFEREYRKVAERVSGFDRLAGENWDVPEDVRDDLEEQIRRARRAQQHAIEKLDSNENDGRTRSEGANESADGDAV